MILGIDASNIRAGGGITHLKELLEYAVPSNYGFKKVVVWCGNHTKNNLPAYEWLEIRNESWLNKSLIFRVYWSLFLFEKQIVEEKVDLLFAPGGTFSNTKIPYVSMSQNMLVYEQKERARFGVSWTRIRLKLLNYFQSNSIKKAEGVIFISFYAKKYITEKIGLRTKLDTVIYHGISDRFRRVPTQGTNIDFSAENMFKLSYVSIINVYKHQWNVAQAVLELNNEGYHIQVDFIGPYYKKSLKKLSKYLVEDNINYLGKIDYKEIEREYKKADAFIFASSCENMPNILVEAMSAGLPIACSNYGPMPEILLEAGLYFDPLEVKEIKKTIAKLYGDVNLRVELSKKAYQQSLDFNWETTSNKTFEFLHQVAKS